MTERLRNLVDDVQPTTAGTVETALYEITGVHKKLGTLYKDSAQELAEVRHNLNLSARMNPEQQKAEIGKLDYRLLVLRSTLSETLLALSKEI